MKVRALELVVADESDRSGATGEALSPRLVISPVAHRDLRQRRGDELDRWFRKGLCYLCESDERPRSECLFEANLPRKHLPRSLTSASRVQFDTALPGYNQSRPCSLLTVVQAHNKSLLEPGHLPLLEHERSRYHIDRHVLSTPRERRGKHAAATPSRVPTPYCGVGSHKEAADLCLSSSTSSR